MPGKFLIIDNSKDGVAFDFLLNNKIVQAEFKGKDILFCFDRFLKKLKIKPADITHLGVVTGVGRFTSSRLAATLANTMAYALQIPIISVKPEYNLIEAFAEVKKIPVGQFVIPKYSGEANIGKKYDF